MKKITFFILCLAMIKSNAQSSNWTKDDRNNLYSDCMSYTTKYKTISGEQKESICLCYLDETTKKYLKKDFQEKIEIELKRIQESTTNQCAKNIGVDLSAIGNVVEPKAQVNNGMFKKEDFNGIWLFDEGVYTFRSDDGEFKFVNQAHANEGRGNWFLDGKTLILEDTKSLLRWASDKFEIASANSSEITLIRMRDKKICYLKKSK